jgi:hypothetical protein
MKQPAHDEKTIYRRDFSCHSLGYGRRGGWQNDINFDLTSSRGRTALSRCNRRSAFNALTETVKKREPSLEDVVRETLRPMLKAWLDENLPRVVERMVQAEIERVSKNQPAS